jgi:hypothetical protein
MEWWTEYWLRKAKKPAREAFAKRVTTEERFLQVMTATRAQRAEMLSKEPVKRPHAATWLNQERWEDEPDAVALPKRDDTDEALVQQIYGDRV